MEIQRAHDILCAFILEEVPGTKSSQEVKERISVACDALCWVLDDRCGRPDTFGENLKKLIEAAGRQGLRLKLRTYSIDEEHRSITCARCGWTSYHPKDVENRYCGKCEVFHDDIAEGDREAWINGA